MMQAVTVRSYPPPPVDRREILRYAGVRGETKEFDAILDECLAELGEHLVYRVCFAEYPLSPSENGTLDLGFMKSASSDLARAFSHCTGVLLFAATVGVELDRLMLRYGKIAPVKALFFQAIGAERIESLCELFFTEMQEERARRGQALTPRFSAGYGDFSLEAQKEIFASLDCARKIGLTLNESLLMSPTKSVTALCGLISK